MYILFKIKFPIDLIKLSSHIKLIQNLIPNKIYITNKLYKFTIIINNWLISTLNSVNR